MEAGEFFSVNANVAGAMWDEKKTSGGFPSVLSMHSDARFQNMKGQKAENQKTVSCFVIPLWPLEDAIRSSWLKFSPVGSANGLFLYTDSKALYRGRPTKA